MSYSRVILGMGCDPNRAAFAKKNWCPRLGVDMDFARDAYSVFRMVQAKDYAVFFVAPGMCSLLGKDGVEEVFERVKAIRPNIKCVYITDVTQAISVLSNALGVQGLKDVNSMSSDWPFVD